jgi:hypothetical protein
MSKRIRAQRERDAMGLGIAVGILDELDAHPEGVAHFREQLEIANALLEEAGLPRHEEPSKLPELRSRAACTWGASSRPLMHGLGLLRLVTSQFVHVHEP